MVTSTKKKPTIAKKKPATKKATVAAKKVTVEQQEYGVRVKLGLIVFIMLAFSFLLIVLTKYQ